MVGGATDCCGAVLRGSLPAGRTRLPRERCTSHPSALDPTLPHRLPALLAPPAPPRADITVAAGASMNVFRRGRGVDLNLDHHRAGPFANLFTDLNMVGGCCGEGVQAGLSSAGAAWRRLELAPPSCRAPAGLRHAPLCVWRPKGPGRQLRAGVHLLGPAGHRQRAAAAAAPATQPTATATAAAPATPEALRPPAAAAAARSCGGGAVSALASTSLAFTALTSTATTTQAAAS